MSAADNAALMRRWFEEVWNQQREETVDELMHDDVVGYHENEELHGREEAKGFFRSTVKVIRNLELTVTNVVAQDDDVVVEWLTRGTHMGEVLGVPPSGKEIEIGGYTWVRIADGVIAEFRTYWNATRVLSERLEQALAEIEVLQGILPICSHCKKIRNDRGYWERLEEYIGNRSLAEFTHSICPSCLDAHYAEPGD